MAAFKRAGLHKLACPAVTCDSYVYATVAQLERVGVPCCACGVAFVPVEVELAELLDIDCAAVDEYRAEIESVWRGQESHGKRLGGATLRDPHELAMSRIVKRRREDARRRRVSALLPTPEPMPF